MTKFFFSWGFLKYKNEREEGGFGNKNIKNWEPFMLNLFFMLRLFFFRRRRGFKKERSLSERVHLRECDDFILFFLLLYIAKLLCPKIVIFFGPFPEKKIHTESFFYYLNAVLPHLETISEHFLSPSPLLHLILPFTFFISSVEMKKIPFLVFFSLFLYIKKLAWRQQGGRGGTSVRDDVKWRKMKKAQNGVHGFFAFFSLLF